MKCCGITGPDDYIPVLNSTDLPRSCCLNLAKDKPCTTVNASKNGCKASLLTYLSSQSTILGAVALAVGIIQVCTECISCMNSFLKIFWFVYFIQIDKIANQNLYGFQLISIFHFCRSSVLDMPAACIVHSAKTTKPYKCKPNQIQSNHIESELRSMENCKRRRNNTTTKQNRIKNITNVFWREHIHISNIDHIFRSIIYLRLSLNHLYER